MFALQGRSKDNRRLDGRRNKGRARNTGKEIKGVPKEMLKGIPVAARTSTLERLYNFPPKCKGKHEFVYGRVGIFHICDNNMPFPMYGDVCVDCGEMKR